MSVTSQLKNIDLYVPEPVGSMRVFDEIFVPPLIASCCLVTMCLRALFGAHGHVAVGRYGRGSGLWLNRTRFVGCLGLLCLSVHRLLMATGGLWLKAQIGGLVFTYGTATFLAMQVVGGFNLLLLGKTLPTAPLNAIMFSTWMVFMWRDIWPLATYTLEPIDSLNPTFWTEMAILSLVGVVIPVFSPRRYVPVNPKNPDTPHPEQTASIVSLMSFSFVNPIIAAATRVAHLSHEMLPPVADYDRAAYLVDKNFKHLDPLSGAKRRHIFFNVMRILRGEYTAMCTAATIQSISPFAAPFAVNRLLIYFETNGSEATVNPWIWVLLLFAGPLVTTLALQWYAYVATQAWTRAQTLFVQLVFDHSLKIRFKAEAPSNTTDSEVDDSSTPLGDGAAPKGGNLIGKINTLITVDLDNIIFAKDVFLHVIYIAVSGTLGVIFLYSLLGWSSLVGCASIIVFMPLPGYLGSLMQTTQKRQMDAIDARVEVVSETIGVLRMIKMFGWEPQMNKLIEARRLEELKYIWREKVLQTCINVVNTLIPVVTTVVTFALYTVVQKGSLSSSKLFSSFAAFIIIKNVLHRVSFVYAPAMRGKVSLERFQSFLEDTELLDTFDAPRSNRTNLQQSPPQEYIGFNDAVFAWSKTDARESSTPSSRRFRLRIDGNVTFKKNGFNLIVGPTGSGKTSVLLALLGEMHFMPSTLTSWYNLPRDGGVAYAAQESWVQNETIRDNILFGSAWDEARYKKVIYQCALERDLELFDAGDATEVGEKGLTLSGGQKARLTLARAVYSDAEILLLDDVLAALDVHTAKWVVNKCFMGDLLKGRTVILVTHNIALTSPIADFVVAVGKDGRVQAIGSDAFMAVSRVPELAATLDHEKEELEADKEVIDAAEPVSEGAKVPDGKLIVAEEIIEGRLRWRTLGLFILNFSSRPIAFLLVWMFGVGLMHATETASVWFLGYWGSQYETHDPSEVDVTFYLTVYGSTLIFAGVIYTLSQAFYYSGTMRTSRILHAELVRSVLSAPLRWLDRTPASRILTRVTGDIAGIDTEIPSQFAFLVEGSLAIVMRVIGPAIVNPIFIVPSVIVCMIGVHIGLVFLKAQMSVRRERSNAKSPVLAHFGATIVGLVSVRAYGAQAALRQISFQRLDHYLKMSKTSNHLNRWFNLRIDALGATFTGCVAAYLLLTKKTNAANAGFTLNMYLMVCDWILWVVRDFNDFEIECNKIERIQSYLEIEHEPAPTPNGVPPAAWPTTGALVVEDLSARYSPDGPKVLQNISFTVKSGERIGIVGRTGSGKSSLTLALLRCILTEGTVYLDGIPTSKINLDALRSAITIIPQMPELLSGTLRRNLDPFEEHDDATLNNALRSAGLFELQDENDEARITLDTAIASGGGNLSVGQRQVIALARAMVRNSRLLILDEATSAIDHKTDAVIQTTLRNELGSNVTVLTIAHRLQTIMDADKVMVLDSGRIVEFGSPEQLLGMRDGAFKSMVEGSDDREALYKMTGGKGTDGGG